MAIVGDGLINAEGENHKRQRKMMSPAFSHSSVKVINYTFINELLGLIDKFDTRYFVSI
jgi:cytochrome P450